MMYKDGIGIAIGENILFGKTPTFADWTVDPAGDVDRLTDGSLATAMTSGSNDLLGAWEYAYIDFAVENGIYLVGGYGTIVCAAANGYVFVSTSGGKTSYGITLDEDLAFLAPMFAQVTDGVIRYGLTADGASTVTPNFFELWATRIS